MATIGPVRPARVGPPVTVAGLLLAAVFACSSESTTGPGRTLDPEAARFITEDIPRFWVAFDQMIGVLDTMPFRREYLDRGTVGLKEFTAKRWKNAQALAQTAWFRRTYYRSIRENSLAIQALEPQFRALYRSLDTAYSGAVFPDVYFCIGVMATGGTTGQSGLFIGAELFSLAPDSPVDELAPWQQTVVRPPEALPAIVAHELVHYQQRYPGSSLLVQAIREGGADFVGELLSGANINAHLRAYGDANEAELWAEFRAVMQGANYSDWLYNGGQTTSERPADLGYYVGYRITEAYYARAADKRQALRDIFAISDAEAFLEASGYPERFP